MDKKYLNYSAKLMQVGSTSDKYLGRYNKSSSLLARTLKNIEISDDSSSSKHNEILSQRRKAKKHLKTYTSYEQDQTPGFGVDIQSSQQDNSKAKNSIDDSLAVINEITDASNISVCALEDELPTKQVQQVRIPIKCSIQSKFEEIFYDLL